MPVSILDLDKDVPEPGTKYAALHSHSIVAGGFEEMS